MGEVEKKERLEVLKKTFEQIVSHIASHKDLLLSPEGRCGTIDYAEGERYAITHTIKKRDRKKTYYIGYKITIGIQEGLVDAIPSSSPV